ncbi:MAG TPA: 16S rRNA (adenine(1518)-N(6)/adenine(1519)-N(6))-dimethyltransferase RsmA [Steroidobacteraceae bacterium]|nr:16S rRNA (adenine(1518)-N(6)/adenine(1519)-N(6))-dimethyltransferase RsmA [Steroidobacteraceae bacterium]
MPIRKRFGQHFLHDPSVIQRIVAAIAPRRGEALVEIGPGPGVLTQPLLAACGRLDAIEIDRDLAATLRERHESQGLVLHVGDVLRFDWARLAAERGQRLRVVGNLPYNISTPLLFGLLGQSAHLADLCFMMQKEVVARIVAAPDTEHYGRLGVMLAPRVRSEWLFDVGPGAFRPPPRVWSSVLSMSVLPDPPAWSLGEPYAAVVSAAFGQRRKTLRNALAALLPASAIEAAGVDPGARAEQLAPADFGRLAQQRQAMVHLQP